MSTGRRGRSPIEFMVMVVALWVVLVGLVVVPAYVDYETVPEVLASKTITLDMTDFDFSEDEIVVAPGTDLTFQLVNAGDAQHNFGLNDDDVTPRIEPGQSGTYHAGVLKADTEFFCLISGHAEQGMVVTVRVSEG